MEIRTEFLNLLTGVAVFICGIMNLSQGLFEMGANWILFGAMYLIMDDYVQNTHLETKLEKATDWGRSVFSWVGFFASVVLLCYYVNLFWF